MKIGLLTDARYGSLSFGQVVWLSINLLSAWEPAGQATQVSTSPVKGLSVSKTTKPHHTPLHHWVVSRARYGE